MLARGEFDLDADDRVGHALAVAGGRRAARGPARRCAACATPTRGGVASVLNELARASGVAMIVREAAVPVDPAVAGAAEILGIDPMYVANEGRLVAFVAPEAADGAALARCAASAGEASRRPRSAR